MNIEQLSPKKDAMELVYHKLTTDIRELQQNILSITVLGFTQNPLLAHKTISEQISELNSLTSDLEDLYKILTNIYSLGGMLSNYQLDTACRVHNQTMSDSK